MNQRHLMRFEFNNTYFSFDKNHEKQNIVKCQICVLHGDLDKSRMIFDVHLLYEV